MWNVGAQRVDIHSDHNRFRGGKMVDVIKFSKKIISVGYQTRYIMQKSLENGINISRATNIKELSASRTNIPSDHCPH